MADVLKLGKTSGVNLAAVAASDIDLLAGTLKLDLGGFAPGSPFERGAWAGSPYGGTYVFDSFEGTSEVLALIGRDTTAQLRAAADAIDDALAEALRARVERAREVDLWWLHFALDGETEKRSLLYRGALAQRAENAGVAGAFLKKGTMRANLQLDRQPFWESISGTTQSDTSVSADGGTMSLTDPGGTAPARINLTHLAGAQEESNGPIGRCWIGIRPEYNGLSAFEPVWACEDGTNGTDATDAGEPTAVTSNKVVVSFATDTSLVRRMFISVGDVLSSYGHLVTENTHYFGTYRVLVRARVTGATTCGMEMRYGYDATDANLKRYTAEYPDDTDWRYYDMGEILIPPEGPYATDAYNCAIHLFAERLEGSGNLELDCIMLVPAEHFMYLNDVEIQYHSGTTVTRGVRAYVTPYDVQRVALYVEEFSSDTSPEFSFPNWYLPAGEDSQLVFVGERLTSPTTGDSVLIQLTHYSRWRGYRP